ncbi:lysine--tRNA ligase [Candidatus Pacearchaeota archaeon]|nr:MAG: lysine--tRNA ligase [Candidatus Pacearchaeota archaeon]
MGREEQIIKSRKEKIDKLRAEGIDPYPHFFEKKDWIKDIRAKYSNLTAGANSGEEVQTAGRLIARREFGKISFGVLREESAEIQIVLDSSSPKESARLFKKFVDIGDFIGVRGEVGKTKRGELSVMVREIKVLSKSIRPLPEKWHGLKDKEERYRKRYLDLLMNPEVKEVFNKREKILQEIRNFMLSRGFHEVETPYLQTVYGGASARPFKTHLNALDIDLYLAISPELYLKRLIVGGYEKVFTIARNFRNEGIDKWHNPEFTMMEIYQAYADYNTMMELFEDLYIHVVKSLYGKTKIKYRDTTLDFKKPWKRMTMLQAIKEFAKIDIEKMSDEEVIAFAEKHNLELKERKWGWAVQAIFEEFCEKELIQPTFILDHPIETTPLCKPHRNDPSKRLIERFEPFCMGAELGNAYSELNDPVLQRELLKQQQKMLSKGDEEANPYDEDFVQAIETGMPPTGGLGVGIDRMIILLTNQESIRDVILFPFMKPLKGE